MVRGQEVKRDRDCAPRPFASKNAAPPVPRFLAIRSGKASAISAPTLKSPRPLAGEEMSATSAHLCAMARASRARAERSRRSAARRSCMSMSSPPRPRSPISAASSAASVPWPTRAASITMRASRGGSGRRRNCRPSSVMRPLSVDGAECGKQRSCLGERGTRRRIEEGELVGVGAPGGEIEREGGQIGGEDFRTRERFERRGLRLVPQPVADARLGAPGATAALIRRRARHPHGVEPRHADIGLVARHARQPAVDDDAHALDGDRGFGNRSRQHDFAAAGRGRCDGAVLLVAAERAIERRRYRSRHRHGLAAASWVRRISAAPGQKCEQRAPLGAHRPHDRVGDLRLDRPRVAADIAGLDRKGAALRFRLPARRRGARRRARRRSSPT